MQVQKETPNNVQIIYKSHGTLIVQKKKSLKVTWNKISPCRFYDNSESKVTKGHFRDYNSLQHSVTFSILMTLTITKRKEILPPQQHQPYSSEQGKTQLNYHIL